MLDPNPTSQWLKILEDNSPIPTTNKGIAMLITNMFDTLTPFSLLFIVEDNFL